MSRIEVTSDFLSPLELKKMEPSIYSYESWITKAFAALLKKITETRPCIEMIQLLLYQINWPAILDLESVGTGPSSHPILLPFRGNFLCF